MRCRILSKPSRSTPHREATCGNLLQGGNYEEDQHMSLIPRRGVTYLHRNNCEPREQDQCFREDTDDQASQETCSRGRQSSKHRPSHPIITLARADTTTQDGAPPTCKTSPRELPDHLWVQPLLWLVYSPRGNRRAPARGRHGVEAHGVSLSLAVGKEEAC